MAASFLTWRTYRDRSRAPVPVLRATGDGRQDTASAEHAQLHYTVHGVESSDGSVHVGRYSEAEGLYTGRVWTNSPELPASAMRREPILLIHDQSQPGYGEEPYGSPEPETSPEPLGYGSPVRGSRRSLAMPVWASKRAPRLSEAEGYFDETWGLYGRNGIAEPRVDIDPHIRMQDGAPVLFTPQTLHDRLGGGEAVLAATGIGDGVFQIPAGYPSGPSQVVVGGEVFGDDPDETVDYDAYHGTIYLEYASGDPVSVEAVVDVTIDTSRSMTLSLADFDVGTYPIVRTPAGDLRIGHHHGPTVAMLVVDRPPIYNDTRRLAPMRDENGSAAVERHRVGQAHYDASPVSSRHCWVIETDAPPERLREAVQRSMPAGTLYRQIPMFGPATAVEG